jgi:hypothetical protein
LDEALVPVALHEPPCRAFERASRRWRHRPVIRGSLSRRPPEMEFLVARAIRSGPGRP